MLPLMRHWHWLTVEQRNRITDAVPRKLAINAWRSDLGTSWRAVAVHAEFLRNMITGASQADGAGPTSNPVPALSSGSGHSDDICGCTVLFTRIKARQPQQRHFLC
jgi:hypothetical protein